MYATWQQPFNLFMQLYLDKVCSCCDGRYQSKAETRLHMHVHESIQVCQIPSYSSLQPRTVLKRSSSKDDDTKHEKSEGDESSPKAPKKAPKKPKAKAEGKSKKAATVK